MKFIFFAQGEARSICQILQIELGNLAIPIGINNTDFFQTILLQQEYYDTYYQY